MPRQYKLAPRPHCLIVRHESVGPPALEVLCDVRASGYLVEECPQFLRKPPASRVLRPLTDMFHRELEQPILRAIRRIDVVADLKVVLSPRWQAKLPHCVQLSSEVAFRSFDAHVVRPHTSFDQVVKRG
ncbi:hypothetical protein CBM2608_A10108 [Cupriavidus taiwanensis]|nr:hypothetical protein CBM2608_A10108 [Cupriavidus taiwanensis]